MTVSGISTEKIYFGGCTCRIHNFVVDKTYVWFVSVECSDILFIVKVKHSISME